MPTDERWTAETLYLARNAHAQHSITTHGPDEDSDDYDFGWDWTCTCGATEEGFNMWGAAQDSATLHQMTAALAALADAGLLLPPGGDVREEWATRDLDIESTQRVVTACRDRFEAERMFEYFDQVWGHHTELISRTVHTGPWRVVDPEGAPDGA